ncbi:hypothetical protein WG926_18900 [Tistrella sp. BH-R2-4]|uniref:Polysaccharide biosynthesis protein n=1 Tax=Tistrella arctica TaxID=3133430 RepID=A0ABU9YNJ7_9PROT
MRRLHRLVGAGGQHLVPPLMALVASVLVVRSGGAGQGGASLWGEVVRHMLIIGLAAAVVNWGVRDYLVRAMAHHPGQRVQIWQRDVATRSLLLLPPAMVAMWLALALTAEPGQRLGSADAVLSGIWLITMVTAGHFESLGVHQGRFMGGFKADLVVGTVVIVVLLLAAVADAGRHLSPGRLLLLFTLADMARTSWRFRVFRDTVGRPPQTRPPGGGWQQMIDRDHLRRTWPFCLVALTGLLASRADTYLVGLYLPAADLGIYQVNASVFQAVQVISALMAMTATRSIYRLQAASVGRMARRHLLVGAGLIAVAIPAAWGLLTIGMGFEVAPLLPILGGLAALPGFYVLPVLLHGYRRGWERRIAWLSLGSTVVIVLAGMALIPRIGMVGAQAASLAGSLVQAAICMTVLRGRRPARS